MSVNRAYLKVFSKRVQQVCQSTILRTQKINLSESSSHSFRSNYNNDKNSLQKLHDSEKGTEFFTLKKVIQESVKTYPVNKSTFLSNVPSGMVFAFTSFHFQKGCVFVLVPQTALKAGENGLGVQSSGLWCHF